MKIKPNFIFLSQYYLPTIMQNTVPPVAETWPVMFILTLEKSCRSASLSIRKWTSTIVVEYRCTHIFKDKKSPFTVRIMFSLKDWLCRDMPRPISREDCLNAQKNQVRGIVADLSRGNASLQQGQFISTNDLERLRSENKMHRFCKEWALRKTLNLAQNLLDFFAKFGILHGEKKNQVERRALSA